jgi:phosphatidate cytidylyltransferase
MLKYRVMTATILIVLLLGILFYTPPPVFCLLTVALTLWASWEWSLLMGLEKLTHRLSYVAVMLLAMLAIFFVPIPIVACIYFFYVIFAFWLLTIPLIAVYPRVLFWKKSLVMQGFIGMVVLLPSWFAINFIRDVDVRGQYLLLYLFLLVWGADTAAYFAGRRWGKKSLVPAVSPGKNREGLYGALAATIVITVVPLCWFEVPYSLWPYMLTLNVVTVLFSVVGDLWESLFKRSAGLKDSGKGLPGHGGLLDRIDSLTAAAPVFTLGAIILSRMGA